MKEKDESESKKSTWEDLILSTIEKIASAPSKIKDSSMTFDWAKNMGAEIQDRIRDEIGQRIGKLDWEKLSKKVGDHLAQNYRLKVSANIEWEPKKSESSKDHADEPEPPLS
jgi:predicted transcriptional regulator